MSEDKINHLVEELSQLTVLDMSKLKEALESKWGVKAAAAAPAMMMAGPSEAAVAAPEATEFQVVLEESPADKKIAVIKVIREITGLGLKEAKDLVDGAPKVVKEKAPKAEAEDISKKLIAAGAKVALKGL
ncbi:MAG: 50S ribosomal protein L7/L12 [Chlamydiota bacterium]